MAEFEIRRTFTVVLSYAETLAIEEALQYHHDHLSYQSDDNAVGDAELSRINTLRKQFTQNVIGGD